MFVVAAIWKGLPIGQERGSTITNQVKEVSAEEVSLFFKERGLKNFKMD
jgi:hypothetical protein